MKEISTKELESLLTGSIDLLDVRDPEDFQAGHIAQAINLPPMQVQSAEFAKDKTYYIICYSGNRSRMMGEYLESQGINTVSVKGGMHAYKGAVVR